MPTNRLRGFCSRWPAAGLFKADAEVEDTKEKRPGKQLMNRPEIPRLIEKQGSLLRKSGEKAG